MWRKRNVLHIGLHTLTPYERYLTHVYREDVTPFGEEPSGREVGGGASIEPLGQLPPGATSPDTDESERDWLTEGHVNDNIQIDS